MPYGYYNNNFVIKYEYKIKIFIKWLKFNNVFYNLSKSSYYLNVAKEMPI